MLQIFKSSGTGLEELTLNNLEAGAWINLTDPTNDEITSVANKLNIDPLYIKDALDIEERSRIEFDDNMILIITNIPIIEKENNFDTIPIGVIITPNHIITATLYENKVISFFSQDAPNTFSTEKRTNFLFQILFKSTKFYLKYLEAINKKTDIIELDLRKTMKNKVLFQLFEIQKSLVYFTTALKNNGIVLEKLIRIKDNYKVDHLLNLSKENYDTLEDAIVENKQAYDMVEMHRKILENMLDVFASVISNNLNNVMKFLTSITIMLAVPTMISGFWGMNVPVPFTEFQFGFLIIAVFAILFSLFIGYKLWQKDMF